MKNDIHNPLHWRAIIRGSGIWKGQNSVVEIYLSKRYPKDCAQNNMENSASPKTPQHIPWDNRMGMYQLP